MKPVADVRHIAAIVDRLPTGVILVTREELRMAYANAAARRLLHPLPLRTGDPLPDPWRDLSLPQYAQSLFEGDPPREEEAHPDEHRTYVVNGIAPRKPQLAVVLLDDITGRERRRRAETEFVANAAHELLTPLTGLVGAAHVLEAGAKEVPEERDRFIAHISQECARLTQIARSLLVLARAQSGEEPPRLEVLALAPLLTEAVRSANGAAERFEIDCHEEITVLADADLFAQAMTNVVRNSVRHGIGETVAVSATELWPNMVGIQLSDGSALQDARRQEEWRRFSTGGGRDGGGFGLGLSIAAQSLEVMGGKLVVDVVDAPGVFVRVELPSGRTRAR